MGLQYNVQRLDAVTLQVEGWTGDVPRVRYGTLAVVTGMMTEKLAREGWSQLVEKEQAYAILMTFGDNQAAKEVWQRDVTSVWRVTIA